MENSLDPVHLEYLHSVYMNYVMKRQGKPPASKTLHHERIAFDVFEYGITKRRLWEGQSEDCDEWQIGHPILFPNILSVGESQRPTYQIRVPMNDTHTLHFWYATRVRDDTAPPQDAASIPVYEYPYKYEDGRLVVDTVSGQDMMAWVTQGDISDRTTERLGSSDQGIILYRGLLEEQMQRVERGEDPMAVIRDPAKNTPMVQVPRERINAFTASGANAELMAVRRDLPSGGR